MINRLKLAPCIQETKNVEVQPLSYLTGWLQCTNMFRLVVRCKRTADGRKTYISETRTSELVDINHSAVDKITNKFRFLRSKATDCNI